MANEFTYKAADGKFRNGGDLEGLTVVLFYGASKELLACAYTCYMNIDFDGDPHAYGPRDVPNITPFDNLWNAGWLSPKGFENRGKHVIGNDDRKAAYDTGMPTARKEYEDLRKQRDDLEPKKLEASRKEFEQKIVDADNALKASRQPQAGLDPKAAPADKVALDNRIAAADKTLNDLKQQRAALEPAEVEKAKKDLDENKIPAAKKKVFDLNKYEFKEAYTGEYKKMKELWQPTDANKPTNLGTIFWNWYGLQHMTVDGANSNAGFIDPETNTNKKPVIYHLNFKQTPSPINYEQYEDVYGAFPVVQVASEPGPGYFVSQIAPIPVKVHTRVNMRFPEWDQRSTLLSKDAPIQAYGALSGKIKGQANLNVGDQLLAIRLDTGQSVTFPFLDSGNWDAIGECSSTAYTSLGGTFARVGSGLYKNDSPEPKFLFLAFPNGRSPSSVLSQISKFDNAEEFPVILSYVSLVVAGVKSGSVTRNPLMDYEQWKKLRGERRFNPDVNDYAALIDLPLRDNGYSL